jgi:SAM-dependent methyltransferase
MTRFVVGGLRMSNKLKSEEGLGELFDYVRTEKIRSFYNEYYARAQKSRVHSEFCRLVYGHDFCQHGMLDMNQLDKLIEVAQLQQNGLVLELGCGTGFMAEYISDKTQCQTVGIDISSAAIALARARAQSGKRKLIFETKDIEKLDYPERHFDAVISIDTLYFVEDLENAIRRMAKTLKPDGFMYIFYHVHPDVGRGSDPASRSPLGVVLARLKLAYRTLDLTKENREHWELRREVLLKLKKKFEEEDNMFLYNTRMDEYMQNFGEYHRFLYIVEKDPSMQRRSHSRRAMEPHPAEDDGGSPPGSRRIDLRLRYGRSMRPMGPRSRRRTQR